MAHFHVSWLSDFIFYRHLTFIFEHLSRDYDYHNVSWEIICIYDLTLSKMRGEERNTSCSFRNPCVTLPLNLFFPTHFVLFPSALIWAVDRTVCPARIRFTSSYMWFVCCLRMQIIWHAASSSSHHAMHCCHPELLTPFPWGKAQGAPDGVAVIIQLVLRDHVW